jgi:hypothetical protein
MSRFIYLPPCPTQPWHYRNRIPMVKLLPPRPKLYRNICRSLKYLELPRCARCRKHTSEQLPFSRSLKSADKSTHMDARMSSLGSEGHIKAKLGDFWTSFGISCSCVLMRVREKKTWLSSAHYFGIRNSERTSKAS